MKMENRRSLHIVAGVFFGFALIVSMTADAADQNPCSKEMATYCKKIAPGTSTMMDCLEKHEHQLSNSCKDYEKTMGGARVEMKEEARDIADYRKASSADVTKFCKDVSPENDGTAACLRQHEKKLSATCLKSIQERKNEEKGTAKPR